MSWVEMDSNVQQKTLENKMKVSKSLSFKNGASAVNAKKNNTTKSCNRMLISVTVIGSAGPLRFLVNADEAVTTVIEQTLKSYAHEGRLPVLGSNFNNFLLYCANGGSDALSPQERIGTLGLRNFVLCKKPQIQTSEFPEMVKAHGGGGWKTWFHKSLHLKISSH